MEFLNYPPVMICLLSMDFDFDFPLDYVFFSTSCRCIFVKKILYFVFYILDPQYCVSYKLTILLFLLLKLKLRNCFTCIFPDFQCVNFYARFSFVNSQFSFVNARFFFVKIFMFYLLNFFTGVDFNLPVIFISLVTFSKFICFKFDFILSIFLLRNHAASCLFYSSNYFLGILKFSFVAFQFPLFCFLNFFIVIDFLPLYLPVIYFSC